MTKLSKKEKVIHDEFQKYGKNAKEWMRKCVLLLPKIESEKIWKKKGFGSIYEYAAKIAGMSHNKVNEGLRVLRRTENMPELRKVIEKKWIWAVAPVLKVATPENQEIWAQKAMVMSQHTLATCVRDSIRDGNAQIGHGAVAKNAADLGCKPILFEKIATYLQLDTEVIEELEQLRGKQDWNSFMKEMIELKKQKEKQFQEQLESEKPEPIKTNSAYRPAKIDKFVKKRANNMCEESVCTKPGVLVHHTEPFALSREHNPDKLKLLCQAHHDIVHSEVGSGSGNEEDMNERLKSLINVKYIKHKWAR